MRTLETAFAALLGTQPSDQSRQGLYRIRDALNLRDDDALWLLLMALGHYETLYGRIPALIREATATLLAGLRQTAEAEMKVTSERTKQDLSKAVARTAEQVASRTTRSKLLKWAAVCISATTIACCRWVGGRIGKGQAQDTHVAGRKLISSRPTNEPQRRGQTPQKAAWATGLPRSAAFGSWRPVRAGGGNARATSVSPSPCPDPSTGGACPGEKACLPRAASGGR